MGLKFELDDYMLEEALKEGERPTTPFAEYVKEVRWRNKPFLYRLLKNEFVRIKSSLGWSGVVIVGLTTLLNIVVFPSGLVCFLIWLGTTGWDIRKALRIRTQTEIKDWRQAIW